MSRHSTSNRAAAAAFALAAAVSCRDATAPTPPALVVDVTATAAKASRTGVWAQFSVPVTLRNPSDVAMRVVGCGPLAEREVAPQQWETALSPFCDLLGPVLEIPAHGEIVRETMVSGSLSSAAGPMFLGGVLGGRYRLVYYYAVAGFAGNMPQARSVPFDVSE